MKRFLKHKLVKPETIELRAYQEGIAKAVLEKGNTLVVAPTALGKTIVAVMLAAELLAKETGKVLFLAPTKPLVEQHKKSFQKMMNIPAEEIVVLTGAIPVKKRAEMFEEATIINATPQTIRNDLRHDRISMEEVLLCIFDEAHRAVGEYSYVPIAERYMEEAKKPLVLALTASPGSDEEKISRVRENLFIKNIEVKQKHDVDVQPYVQETKTEWVKVQLPKDFMTIKKAFDKFSSQQTVLLKRMGLAPTSNIKFFSKKRQLEMQIKLRKRIQMYGKRQPSLYAAASKLAALMKASHALLLLETQGISSLNDYLGRAKKGAMEAGASKALKGFVKDKGIAEAMLLAEKLEEQGIEHPKLIKLERILAKQFSQNPESRAIVFNHYRSSIKKLVEFLELDQMIKPRKFIGQANRGADKGMNQKEQVRVIEELKEGKYNCLVASSVAEEGLDIPAVDLVVFYEPVPSEIRSIQRRGRTGRLSSGRVVVLMAKGTRDEAFYWVSLNKEKRMHKTLAGLKENGDAVKQTKLGKWK